MPEIQPDRLDKQFPNRNNPAEHAYLPSPSSFFAIFGGVFASLSSVSAKLAVNQQPGALTMLIHQLMPSTSTNAHLLSLISRAVMLGSIGLSNFFMWLFFTKALRYGDSTPRVMMLQTASNFAMTALCGVYLFGDVLSMQWWWGASLIAAGLVLINSEKSAEFVCESPDHVLEVNGLKESKKTK